MHFPTFEVATTNIFPLSNSTKGGQLVTEYNLRSREMVGSDPAIEYEVGPSYTHGQNDFAISLLSSVEAPEYSSSSTYSIGEYVTYNSVTYVCTQPIVTPEPFDSSKWVIVNAAASIIQVAPGRAVINGHYVQTLAPMTIDLALVNAQLSNTQQAPLVGELSIGIRSYYSTETTMSGSMLVENEDNIYNGIQLVIEKKANFITPSDSPVDRSKVTADLKLADFIYINGVINPAAIVQNKNKVSYINSARIDDISKVLDDNFISKKNLNPWMLYTFSGQGRNSDKSTWCDSTGSLMVWDAHPQDTISTVNPNELIPQATFLTTNDGFVHLAIPHQQIDSMKNSSGDNVYFGLRDIKLPKANYLSGTSGTVDKEYTQVIKNLSEKLGGLKQSPAGSMVLWLDTKDEDYVMPTIPTSYANGDYIFVREDYTARTSEDEGAAPSTMYKVLPGTVSNLEYSENLPKGIRLGDAAVAIWEGDNPGLTVEDLKHIADFYDTETQYAVDDYAAFNGGLYKCTGATSGEWDPSKWNRILAEDATTLFDFTSYRGTKTKDYFELSFHVTNDTESVPLYYVVSGAGPRTWSEYILVTGGVPLASTIQAGGFYNVDPTFTDGGYVTLDESGRLKLIDYDLLRTGALAYQLGEDITLPSNVTAETIQSSLDEYVNSRVAFPYSPAISGTTPVLNIYITLPDDSDSDEVSTINIYNIDSRFGTAVQINILGSATAKTIVNIIDCEKVRINSNIYGTPVINVVRSCLYYDANVLNYIRICDTNGYRVSGFTGMQDITLWYDKFSETDSDLTINGMEVSQPNAPMTTEDIAFWDDNNSNDNHYSSALRSITIGGNGDIIGCSLFVANGSTATNITSGRSIIGGTFNLPQGSELTYPTRCLVKPLKVTGSFSAVYPVSGSMWVTIATNFTAQTGSYNPSTDVISSGSIGFDSTTDLLSSEYMTADTQVIDCWQPGTYHIFYGGVTI